MKTHPLLQTCLDTLNALPGKVNNFGSPAIITSKGATTTCSTFHTMMLAKTYHLNPVMWMAIFGKKWPRARDYFQAYNRLMLGGNTLKISDIKPGTLAAIGYDEDRRNMSGHCFIAMEAPMDVKESRGGSNKHSLRVIDCTQTSHGANDTRWTPEGPKGGIGIGTMAVWASDDGKVTGYSWSMESTSDVMHNGGGQNLSFANVPSDWSLRHG